MSGAEQRRLDQARREADEDRSEILKQARRAKAEHDAVLSGLREAIEALRAERAAQEMSLSDVHQRSGIGRSALCRLENDLEANPTVSTLVRYAEALGKRLVITLAGRQSD